MKRSPLFAAALTAALSRFFTPAAHAQGYTVTVTDLSPTGAVYTQAIGVFGGAQVGVGGIDGGEHALLWTGTADSVVDLHPHGFSGSLAESISGTTQVGLGYLNEPTVLSHALLWHGTAKSVVDLNPEGFANSAAYGVYGGTQVGEGFTFNNSQILDERALLWQGTADSVVSLHPAGFDESEAFGVYGGTQVGTGRNGLGDRALLWHGTADSVVDLTPPGYTSAFAYNASGDEQVGEASATSLNATHALLWRGTAQSVVDLHPVSGFMASAAVDVSGGTQVGSGSSGNREHALLWMGTAESVIDLNKFLPEGFNKQSQAYGVDAQGSVVDVVGLGSSNPGNNGSHAFLWHIVFDTSHPAVTHLDPASRTEGREGFTLTVIGTGFTPQSHVTWNGTAQTTRYVSAFEVAATIPASLITHAGTASVAVITPGVGASDAHPETIMPRPAVTGLSPKSKPAGSGAFILTVTGTGFRPASFYAPSVVKWNGAELATTFVSATQLTAQVPASLVAHSGTATVTVTTPQVATSDGKAFTVTP